MVLDSLAPDREKNSVQHDTIAQGDVKTWVILTLN